MDILIIDRDPLAVQLLTTRLTKLGHTVTAEPSKGAATELMKEKFFDTILIDPMPMRTPRNFILTLRFSEKGFQPYIAYMSTEATQADAIAAGANDLLAKPLDKRDIEAKISNAERLRALHALLNDSRVVESGGGIINKEAFNQLFLSCVSRAGTYGERSFIVFIYMDNYEELCAQAGAAAAGDMVKKLSGFLSDMRRQSDVIARIDDAEFALLLQRPIYADEPFDASKRFTEELSRFINGFENEAHKPELFLSMIEIPLGALHVQTHIKAQTA